LAAAYAACGQLDEAVSTQQRAVDLAPEDKKADFLSRLALYQSGKAYVQPASSEERGQGSEEE
jgi:hypothetical protein